jgi:hypothetical protein
MTAERIEQIEAYLRRRRESAADAIHELADELIAEIRRLQDIVRFREDPPLDPESVGVVTVGLVDGTERSYPISAGSSFRKIARDLPAAVTMGGAFMLTRETTLRWEESPREVSLEEYQQAVVDLMNVRGENTGVRSQESE